jgi:hypothetical protein
LQFDRAQYASLEFATNYSLSSSSLDDLIHWRAQRYVRTAFPDSFEKAFDAFHSKFRKLMSRHEQAIDSLLLSLDPFDEITKGDCYQMQLRLMTSPSVLAQPDLIGKLHKLSQEIENLFKESPWFDDPKCGVMALDQMTLWEGRRFVDFTRYDYLSFGQDDLTSDSPLS